VNGVDVTFPAEQGEMEEEAGFWRRREKSREFKANGLVKEMVCGCLAEEEFVWRKVPGSWKSFLEVEKTTKLR
jgi:hypothetical protein